MTTNGIVRPISPPVLELSKDNLQIARRLDQNKDGTIEPAEAKLANAQGGNTRVDNETKDLSPAEFETLDQLFYPGAQPVTVSAKGAKVDSAAGYDAAAEAIFEAAANRKAPLGSVGQGRIGALRNNDCGPTAALFVGDRRIAKATGAEPERTHAEADAEIEQRSKPRGATDGEMVRLMDDGLNHAGGQIYSHKAVDVSPSNLREELSRGLESDPGGVVVPTIDTFNEKDQSGTRHWIVATKLLGDRLSYYEPGGPDGANHLREMSLRELGRNLPEPNLLSPNRIVYGEASSEKFASGEMRVGAWVGSHERIGIDEDVRVESHHGVYGSEADARAAAADVAQSGDRDAVITKEAKGWAVYGIAEQKSLDRGLWSSNEIVDRDRRVLDVIRLQASKPSS